MAFLARVGAMKIRGNAMKEPMALPWYCAMKARDSSCESPFMPTKSHERTWM